MKTATRAVVLMVFFLSGCGGCQRGEETTAGGGGAAAPTATSAALQARRSLEAAPPQQPGNHPGGAPRPPVVSNLATTPMAPLAGAAPGEPTAEPEENEGDCIVVADADPDYGPPPLAVTFSAEAECNAGQPTYKWDFGDGSPPSGEINPTHNYSKPGDYTASVTITGPGGSTASDEVDITVEESEGEPQE